MKIGRIKWHNKEKGFGFIYSDFEPDIFYTSTAFNHNVEDLLVENQMVLYETVNAPRGIMADNIKIYKEEDLSPQQAKHDSDSIIEFLKVERENLLNIIGEDLNDFNKGRVYAMDKMIDGLEGIYNNL